MTSKVESISEMTSPQASRRLRRVRHLLAAFALVGVVALSAAAGLPSDANHLGNKKIARTADNFLNIPTLAANPGLTIDCVAAAAAGVKPVVRVEVLLDRSSSVNATEAAQFKQALESTMWQLAAKGIAMNAEIDVYINTFATFTQPQTDMTWLATHSNNVSTPQGLTDLANVPNGLINNIHFYTENPGGPGSGQYGYFGGLPAQGVPEATNWHDALDSTAANIGFWTNHDPNVGANNDFDLVLMVTDGVPTANDGKNELSDLGSPNLGDDDQNQLTTTNGDDWKAPRYAVNALRTGQALRDNAGWGNIVNRNVFQNLDVRPSTNVQAIIINNSLSQADVDTVNNVFGPEGTNWSRAADFGAPLQAQLDNAISPISCQTNQTKHDIIPKIELTVTASAPSVLEGNDVTFQLTAKNVSTIDGVAGDVALTNGIFTLNGTGDLTADDPANAMAGAPYHFGLAHYGDTATFSYTVHIDLGGPSPAAFNFGTEAQAQYDANTYVIVSGNSDKPHDSKMSQVEVMRIPLPT